MQGTYCVLQECNSLPSGPYPRGFDPSALQGRPQRCLRYAFYISFIPNRVWVHLLGRGYLSSPLPLSIVSIPLLCSQVETGI